MLILPVTRIGEHAFADCTGLTGIDLPDALETIGDYAFLRCDSLASLALPAGVEHNGDYAFADCTGLASLGLTEGLATLGDGAFAGCGALAETTLPASVSEVGSYAFWNCASLSSATFLGNAPPPEWFVFDGTAPDFAIHYLTDRSGWTTPTWNGYPASPVGGTNDPADSWLAARGLPAGTPLDRDLNGDGVDLLMAWALDLDPNQNLAASLPRAVLSPTGLSIGFRAANPDVIYTVETSTDMEHWTASGVVLTGPPENRTATVPRDAAQRFLRLVVEER
jgi:hypothetical protein